MTSIDLPTLANRVHGELFSRSNDDVITGAAPLGDAVAGHITLLDHEKNLAKLQVSAASACVTNQTFPGLNIPQIVVKNPHKAFAQICEFFRPEIVVTQQYGIDPLASVSSSAQISDRAMIEAFASVADGCVIGEGTHLHRSVTVMHGCRIGQDCQLFPGVVLYPGTILGDRVVLHANCAIGAHGFGYRMENGKHLPTSQIGWVEIESDVEIGANSCIDRGTYGATRIGEGTKIDNLVHIGHNCKIGKHNLICAQVGFAGSVATEEYVVLGGQVGVRDHIKIGARTMVGAQSGLSADTGEDEILLGYPAIPRNEQAVVWASVKRLPELRKTVKQLVKQVETLKEQEKSDT